jgi:hypothetical protein
MRALAVNMRLGPMFFIDVRDRRLPSLIGQWNALA